MPPGHQVAQMLTSLSRGRLKVFFKDTSRNDPDKEYKLYHVQLWSHPNYVANLNVLHFIPMEGHAIEMIPLDEFWRARFEPYDNDSPLKAIPMPDNLAGI